MHLHTFRIMFSEEPGSWHTCPAFLGRNGSRDAVQISHDPVHGLKEQKRPWAAFGLNDQMRPVKRCHCILCVFKNGERRQRKRHLRHGASVMRPVPTS
ncbi:hypothetical protein L596_004994 [Steinernema carpocapsae]|uniref:Uncharacterized protein n=1 Tax=Steinernema carpocapsae TaxID=34508 RepID=A0A4U8UYM7_STECR|nr:hypothetical protein L596_004994 [Steinernema carpocapsae]